jgi:hypothetical protein
MIEVFSSRLTYRNTAGSYTKKRHEFKEFFTISFSEGVVGSDDVHILPLEGKRYCYHDTNDALAFACAHLS